MMYHMQLEIGVGFYFYHEVMVMVFIYTFWAVWVLPLWTQSAPVGKFNQFIILNQEPDFLI